MITCAAVRSLHGQRDSASPRHIPLETISRDLAIYKTQRRLCRSTLRSMRHFTPESLYFTRFLAEKAGKVERFRHGKCLAIVSRRSSYDSTFSYQCTTRSIASGPGSCTPKTATTVLVLSRTPHASHARRDGTVRHGTARRPSSCVLHAPSAPQLVQLAGKAAT